MAEIRISNIPRTSTVNGSDLIIIDNGIVTNSARIESLSSVFYLRQTLIKHITTPTYTIVDEDSSVYLRIFPDPIDEYGTLPSPVINITSSLTLASGNIITIRNSAATISYISAGPGVTLNTITTAFAPYQTTQLINISANYWDIL